MAKSKSNRAYFQHDVIFNSTKLFNFILYNSTQLIKQNIEIKIYSPITPQTLYQKCIKTAYISLTAFWITLDVNISASLFWQRSCLLYLSMFMFSRARRFSFSLPSYTVNKTLHSSSWYLIYKVSEKHLSYLKSFLPKTVCSRFKTT